MSIITLQKRLREIARIRTGDQVATGTGKTRPRKLTQFRITSRDRRFIDAAAIQYGGTPREWAAPDGPQWEVYTETSEIPVVVPPTDMAFSQAYELWSAGGCQRRCDGERELISDDSCVCDPENRACSLTTRLSVILHELPGLGVCRLESHGYYAAVELGAAVELVKAGFAHGQLLPARLLLEQRQVKRIDANGKAQTRNFVVPCLDFQLSFAALQKIGTVEAAALPVGAAPEVEAPPGFTPVGELPAPPVGSIEEQVRGAGRERSARRGGAEPIRSTGRRPRAAVEVIDDVDDEVTPAASSPAGGDPEPSDVPAPGSPPRSPGGEPTGAEASSRAAAGDGDVVTPTAEGRGEDRHGAASPPGAAPTTRARRAAMLCKNAGITTDDDRHAFVALVTGGRHTSGKTLDDTDFALVEDAAARVRRGELRFVRSPIDGTARLDEHQAVDPDDPAWWDETRWADLAKQHGKTKASVLRHARAVAEELGVAPPRVFAGWDDGRISAAVAAWITAGEAG